MKLDPPPPLSVADNSPYWDYARALVGITHEINADLLIQGINEGLVPMAIPEEFLADPSLADRSAIGWWSPDPRAVLRFEDLKVSRSLRRSCRRFRFSADQAFEAVLDGCIAQPREDAWIDDRMRVTYLDLHERGVAHSVEVWNKDDDTLVGGIFGLLSRRGFCGESMFHTASDGSKAALVALMTWLDANGYRFMDVQWATPFLESMGVQNVDPATLDRLISAVEQRPLSAVAELSVPLT